VADLLRQIDTVGTDPTRGGYSRPVWNPAEPIIMGSLRGFLL
jgi:hypothetical protein